MKTIKELESEGWDSSFIFGYNDCKKDILELIDELKNKIDDAQEDFGNLDWISKEQALEIIDKELKQRIEGEKLK